MKRKITIFGLYLLNFCEIVEFKVVECVFKVVLREGLVGDAFYVVLIYIIYMYVIVIDWFIDYYGNLCKKDIENIFNIFFNDIASGSISWFIVYYSFRFIFWKI